MTLETESARAKLAGMIQAAGITMDCMAIDKRSTFADTWKGSKASHYRCKLTKPGGLYYQCEYSVGRGIVRQWAVEHAGTVKRAFRGGDGWDRRTVSTMTATGTGETLYEKALIDDVAARIYRPDIVDVVSCLLMDASGMSPHETFREWCKRMSDDFGMTWANPADAVDAYDNARLALGFLARAFGDNLEAVTETAGDM